MLVPLGDTRQVAEPGQRRAEPVLVAWHQLIALADRYNIPILEDDFVGDLRYEGRVQPAVKALDPGGRVIYVGSFSKTMLPTLRLGFLVTLRSLRSAIHKAKYVSDSSSAHLC